MGSGRGLDVVVASEDMSVMDGMLDSRGEWRSKSSEGMEVI